MNFYRRGCINRCMSYWNNPNYQNVSKGTSMILPTDEDSKQRSYKPIFTNLLLRGQHNLKNHQRIVPNIVLFSQIRYSNGCPRLHRDLEFPNFDKYRKDEYKDVRKTEWGSGDGKPGFTYVVGFFGLLCGCYSAKSEVTHLVSYMAAAADVLALASIEVDVSNIALGACASYKWRGKPLFIKHRTPEDIESEAKTPVESLRDPQTPEQRTIKQEWLVVIGICTHLGCVPIPNSGDWAGGFYCPCHGSHYDNVGRARKGPAPLNLEVPPYVFVSDNVVLVG